MPKINNWPCTVRQRELTDRFLDDHSIFEQLVHRALAARDAMVSLPHVNEDGEKVLHGANKHMSFIHDCYYNAAQAFVLGFAREINKGDEYFPFMVLRARRNGKLQPWMQRVIDRNGGVIPEVWSYEDTRENT